MATALWGRLRHRPKPHPAAAAAAASAISPPPPSSSPSPSPQHTPSHPHPHHSARRESPRSRMGAAQSSPQGNNRRNMKNGGAPADYIAMMCTNQPPKARFKALIQALIHRCGDINTSAPLDGMTALHFAVLNGDEWCTKALIAFGARINATNRYNQTPLDIAIQNQVESLVPLLVSVGCDRHEGLREKLLASSKQRRQQQQQPPSSSSSCSPASTPPSAGRPRKLSFNFSDVDSPGTLERKKRHTNSVMNFDLSIVPSSCCKESELLSQELEDNIERRFEATMSLNPDEALAIALQQKELSNFRGTLPPQRRQSFNCQNQKEASPGPERQRASPVSVASDVLPSSPMEFVAEGGSRILCLDGGGIRGLVQIEVLCEIERLTGKKITELFDWIIGTSTGGILALGLVYRGMSLQHLRQLYFKLKEQVFAQSRMGGYACNTRALEQLLKEELGTELTMSDVSHPKVLISAVDKTTTRLSLHFFNNCFDDEYSTQPVWKVARYTSAAPMFFSECDNYVDGGVLANNPCDDGLMRIQRFYQEAGTRLPIACVVSMGSGIDPAEDIGLTDAHEILQFGRQWIRFGDALRKAQSLIRLLSSALVESEAVAERCRNSCAEQRIPFYRFSPQMECKMDPGETDNAKLLNMIIAAKIHAHQGSQMDKLILLLLTWAPSP